MAMFHGFLKDLPPTLHPGEPPVPPRRQGDVARHLGRLDAQQLGRQLGTGGRVTAVAWGVAVDGL